MPWEDTAPNRKLDFRKVDYDDAKDGDCRRRIVEWVKGIDAEIDLVEIRVFERSDGARMSCAFMKLAGEIPACSIASCTVDRFGRSDVAVCGFDLGRPDLDEIPSGCWEGGPDR